MTDNDNLELKKRSRRRLVGAAALALLAAIVLPMVMDQEPASPAQDIQVSIPDRDADIASARPIGGRSAPATEPQLAPPPEEDAPTNPPPGDAVTTPGAQTGAAASAVAPADPIANAPAPAASAGAAATLRQQPNAAGSGVASAPASKSAVTAPNATAPKDEAARVRALLEGTQASAKESYVVQVGAFGEATKAASLIADLKGRGLSAYSEKAGSVTRVRVGPFASRDQAEKAAERLRANGLNGVVAPR